MTTWDDSREKVKFVDARKQRGFRACAIWKDREGTERGFKRKQDKVQLFTVKTSNKSRKVRHFAKIAEKRQKKRHL